MQTPCCKILFYFSYKAFFFSSFGWFMNRFSLFGCFCVCFFQRFYNFVYCQTDVNQEAQLRQNQRGNSFVNGAHVLCWECERSGTCKKMIVVWFKGDPSRGFWAALLVRILRTECFLRKGSCIVVDIVYLQRFVLHWNLALSNVQEFYYCTYCTYKIKVPSLSQQTKARHVSFYCGLIVWKHKC